MPPHVSTSTSWTVGNALLVKERQRRIADRGVAEIITRIGSLPIDVDLDSAGFSAFDRVVPLAKRHQLSVYDAFYLELALREHLPLATFDSALVAAAQREGVGVFAG